MTEKLNVYQKLAEIRKEVPYLKKEQQGSQYEYVGSSDVLGALHGKINEMGLILVPTVVNHKVTEQIENGSQYNKYTKQNDEKKRVTYFTEIDMGMTWVNIDDPNDKLYCSWYAQGVDIAGEKGVGKALTYGEKYFLLKFFNIATDKDDPDNFQKKVESKQPPKKISASETKVLKGLIQNLAETQGADYDFAESGVRNKLGIQCDLSEISKDQYGIVLNYLNELKKKIESKKKDDA